MTNAIDLINREIDLQMLITPQSKGVFQKYSKSADNQAANQVTNVMTEMYYTEIDETIRQIISEFIYQTLNKYRLFFEENPTVKETYLYYIATNNQKEAIKITPQMVGHESMFIFVKNSTAALQYRNMMLNYVQAFAQNRGEGMESISNLLLSLYNGASPQVVHSQIVTLAEDQSKKQQAFQIQMKELEMQKEQMLMQEKEAARRMEQYKVDANNQNRLEVATINTYNRQPDLNKDQDGIPDQIEGLVALRKLEQTDRKLDIEERKVNNV
jgi:hypothetical protein